MVCMDEVIDKLYLGGIYSIFEPTVLLDKGITHILSLIERPLPEEQVSKFKYKFVYALDLYDTDLLNELEDCLAFIDEGIRDGSVLVHCQAGASRSATVVAAYVMRKFSIGTEEALQTLRGRRPLVNPNEGFQRQLDLYQLMGWKVDMSHPEFRRYMLSKVAVQSKAGFHEHAIPASIYRSEAPLQLASERPYKCRKCRRILFHSSAVMVHGKGQGESAFDWRSKIPVNQRTASTGDGGEEVMEEEEKNEEFEECQLSLFVEPIDWMKGQIETVEGKLSCPKCKAKLGSFVWYGERCPCGAWVAPAFHVQTSKVDAPQTAVAQIAKPFKPCLLGQATTPTSSTSQPNGEEAPS